jgi:hypothetical protein
MWKIIVRTQYFLHTSPQRVTIINNEEPDRTCAMCGENKKCAHSLGWKSVKSDRF